MAIDSIPEIESLRNILLSINRLTGWSEKELTSMPLSSVFWWCLGIKEEVEKINGERESSSKRRNRSNSR